MLKQDAIIEYLKEQHETYVFVPIEKAVNNVTAILKEIGI